MSCDVCHLQPVNTARIALHVSLATCCTIALQQVVHKLCCRGFLAVHAYASGYAVGLQPPLGCIALQGHAALLLHSVSQNAVLYTGYWCVVWVY